MSINPPYIYNFIAQTDQSFLHLIDAHFPQKHILSKILNEQKKIK